MTALPEKYLVVSASDLEVQEITGKENLVLYLSQLRQEELQNPFNTKVVITQGDRVNVSKGEQKYLIFPGGITIPLFTQPDTIEPDLTGALVEPLMPPIESGDRSDDDGPPIENTDDEFDDEPEEDKIY